MSKPDVVNLAANEPRRPLSFRERTIEALEAGAASIAWLVQRVGALEAKEAKNGNDGVGIKSALIGAADGHLVLTLTNGEIIDLGRVVGRDGVSPEPPKMAPPKDGVGISGALVNAEGHLVLTLTEGNPLDVGRVVGKDGVSPELPKFDQPKDGVGISDATQNADGHLLLVLTDGRTLNVGRVRGKDGESPVFEPPVFEKPRDGTDGVGITDALLDREGCLVLTFGNGTTRNLGRIVGKDGLTPDAVPGPAGRSIQSAAVNEAGHLILTFTDATTADAGLVAKEGKRGDSVKGDPGVGIARAEIEAGQLVLHFTDGTKQKIGRVVGEPGKPAEAIQPPRIEFGTEAVVLDVLQNEPIYVRDLIIDGEVVGRVIV